MSRKIPPPYLAARYGNRQMLPNPTEAPAADSTKPSLPEKVLLDSFDFMFSPIFYSRECLAGCGAAKYFQSGPLFYYSGIVKRVQSYLLKFGLHRAECLKNV